MIPLLSALLRAFSFCFNRQRRSIAYGGSFYWKSVNKFHLVSRNNAMNHKVSKFLLSLPWRWHPHVVKTNLSAKEPEAENLRIHWIVVNFVKIFYSVANSPKKNFPLITKKENKRKMWEVWDLCQKGLLLLK